jgi:hypothetical protein
MRERSMARELVGTVKEVLGTAQSTGCNVDGRVRPSSFSFCLNAPCRWGQYVSFAWPIPFRLILLY